MNLNQITIPSTDIPRAVAFYQQLGLRLIVDSSPRYVRFECPEGDATISIHHVAPFTTNPELVIYFECERLDEVVAELKGKGIVFDAEPQDQNWLWREAYLRDPDGNHLCLFSAGENRRNPPWRVNASGFRIGNVIFWLVFSAVVWAWLCWYDRVAPSWHWTWT
jgi:catechol 2,3-dioxygenase-like lactoylglutathione lyase family enzyme